MRTSIAGRSQLPTRRSMLPYVGELPRFVRNPYKFVKDLSDELGEVAAFELLGQRIVLLTGDEASEVFYRSSDDQLDQAAAYKVMTPVFGEGLVFDAPPERKDEQLRALMPSLRIEAMRNHSGKIVAEVEEAIADWGDEGEIDVTSFFKQLTINTASHCLLGREFRYELSDEFARIYHDLEAGVTPIAYNFPNLPLPAFRRRDAARARLVELVDQIVERRRHATDRPDDLFQSLIDMRYRDGTPLSGNEITGLLIAAIFAGHHTSSGTSSWVLLELLRHPEVQRRTVAELDERFGAHGQITFPSMREVPHLDNVVKEVLRLHPPLIILMREVIREVEVKGHTLQPGDMVWASPPVTHRMRHLFTNPEVFDPDRFTPERGEDRNLMAYQPFGGGHHRCSGNAFATFQIKAIFSVLLRRYHFELAAPPDTYRDDYTEMIVQPASPAVVRYRRRDPAEFATTHGAGRERIEVVDEPHPPAHPALRVVLDRDLCQGHAVCTGEAAAYFHVDDDGTNHLLRELVDAADLDAVDHAVTHCPNKALRLEAVHHAPQGDPA